MDSTSVASAHKLHIFGHTCGHNSTKVTRAQSYLGIIKSCRYPRVKTLMIRRKFYGRIFWNIYLMSLKTLNFHNDFLLDLSYWLGWHLEYKGCFSAKPRKFIFVYFTLKGVHWGFQPLWSRIWTRKSLPWSIKGSSSRFSQKFDNCRSGISAKKTKAICLIIQYKFRDDPGQSFNLGYHRIFYLQYSRSYLFGHKKP